MKTKHTYRTRSLLAIGLASASLFASADILTLHPDAAVRGDGYIRAGQTPDNVDGNLFLVGNTTTNNDELRSFLAFDLSDPSLSGATINSVTLTLTIDDPDTSGGGSVNKTSTLNLSLITESFTESGATWTSRDGTNNWSTVGGTFDTPPLASATANASSVEQGDELQFSGSAFNNAVNNALGGSIGLMVTLDELNYTERTIFRLVSRTPEEFQPEKIPFRPVLEIDYTAIPEPSTFALLAIAGAAGLFLRRRT